MVDVSEQPRGTGVLTQEVIEQPLDCREPERHWHGEQEVRIATAIADAAELLDGGTDTITIRALVPPLFFEVKPDAEVSRPTDASKGV
jgi:hypothetical protein